jgi:hypothetical protein
MYLCTPEDDGFHKIPDPPDLPDLIHCNTVRQKE